jgi:hypothetical protein
MAMNVKFFERVMHDLKELESEVLAHRMTLHVIKQMNLIEDLDATLLAAKQAANKQMDAKYDAVVDTAIQEMQHKNDDEEWFAVLSKLTPSPYIN